MDVRTAAPVVLLPGDCLDIMAALPPDTYDAIVTDPPYHLTSIDKRLGGAGAAEAQEGTDGLFRRSARGFMGKQWDGGDIAFRPETWAAMLRVAKPGAHLVAFNHSRTWHHMAVAIEAAGWEIRDSLVWLYGTGFPKSHDVAKGIDKLRDDRAVPGAMAWEGWGTALKPGFEPIVLARKPLSESSIARQCLATGTGALNIDAARIGGGERRIIPGRAARPASQSIGAVTAAERRETQSGRWPANVAHDGSPEVLGCFPADEKGTVARFFYCAKADAADRAGSDHPTVKPQALMRWLVRLVSRRGARVLDPFGGSGATAWAAATEGRLCDLIERDAGYQAHIRSRLPDFAPALIAERQAAEAREAERDAALDAGAQGSLF